MLGGKGNRKGGKGLGRGKGCGVERDGKEAKEGKRPPNKNFPMAWILR